MLIEESQLPAQALLRLMQLVSPALPVGAFAYSQGIEYAVEARWITTEQQAQDWIVGLLQHSIAKLDVPVLLRLHQAWLTADTAAVINWTTFLHANRESAELRREDEQLGRALARVLNHLGVQQGQLYLENRAPSFITLFALAAVEWRIPYEQAALGYCWAWLEKQVAAVVKLVPLGQTAGLRILNKALIDVPMCVLRAAQLQDMELGAAAPLFAIGSALHETQYSRLCQS